MQFVMYIVVFLNLIAVILMVSSVARQAFPLARIAMLMFGVAAVASLLALSSELLIFQHLWNDYQLSRYNTLFGVIFVVDVVLVAANWILAESWALDREYEGRPLDAHRRE